MYFIQSLDSHGGSIVLKDLLEKAWVRVRTPILVLQKTPTIVLPIREAPTTSSNTTAATGTGTTAQHQLPLLKHPAKEMRATGYVVNADIPARDRRRRPFTPLEYINVIHTKVINPFTKEKYAANCPKNMLYMKTTMEKAIIST